MTKRKTLKELTIKDNFMFGAVMCEEENCKQLLELILGFPIERVEVSTEKCIVYHPEYKGVRLDVYAKDENNTHYNVEMQAVVQRSLGKRARYYHSQIDMELVAAGVEYSVLPKAYVIFICDFDPFGQGKYLYTFRHLCQESADVRLEDESETIFLSTKGQNPTEVAVELIKFLEYVQADLENSITDFNDDFVGKLQKSVHRIKQNRRMEERYMLTELLMQDERRAGRIEGRNEGRLEGRKESILEILSELGEVPESIRLQIRKEDSLDKLKNWAKLVVKAETIEQFAERM